MQKMRIKTDGWIPSYAHEGDAGFDLRTMEQVTLTPGEKRMVRSGLRMEVPSGCVGFMFPRSGLSTMKGVILSNSTGIIDSGYRGEVGIPLWNTSHSTVRIKEGERVAQMVIVPYIQVQFEPVDSLEDTERGADGFGSTGVN